MTNVADTSQIAYAKIAREGKTVSQRERILAFMRECGRPVSRAEIAQYFNHGLPPRFMRFYTGPAIPLASVCGRVNVLLGNAEKGWAAQIRVHHIQDDPNTGHEVEYLEVIEPGPKQREFKWPK